MALAAARAAGDRRSESEILNTLGMAQIVLGDVDEGVDCLREAIEIAREDDDFGRMEGAYSNLAEALNLAGRTPEALETAQGGHGRGHRPGRPGGGLDADHGL